MESLSREELTEIAHLRLLSASLENMRMNNVRTDVTLVCGRQEFQAHGLVLAAVSPYFHSMLGSEWRETASGRIELPYSTAKATDAILSFAYTGKLNKSTILSDNEAMLEILEVADYFQFQNLVDFCFQIFSDLSLTTENFWEMYVLADKFSNKRHISKIESLLAPNLHEASQSQDFLCLTVDHLHSLLQHPRADHSAMEEVFTALLKWTECESDRALRLKELVDTLDLCWCSVWLNKLIRKNLLSKSWSPETKRLLSEIAASRSNILTCHQLTQEAQMLVCFGDSDTVSMYDVEGDQWLASKELPFYLNERMATVSYLRHVFLIGGERDVYFEASASIIQYCPFTNTTAYPEVGHLLYPVCDAGAGIFNESIYVVNGVDKNHCALRLVQCYDIKNSTCHRVSSTLKWHKRPYIFSFMDYLHVFGPAHDNDKSLERYDPVADQWTELNQMTGIHDYTGSYQVTFSGTQLLCFCGANSDSTINGFDLVTEEKAMARVNGPNDICMLWTIRQRGQPFLLAMDNIGTLFFYSTESQWYLLKQEHWAADRTLYHWLCCCI